MHRVFLTLALGASGKSWAWRLARVLLIRPISHPIGVHMRNIIQPLAWFAVLGSFIAAASRVALSLV
ncbi:hypothetical protein C6382_07210 [Pseudomonas sp. BBP2017]|nr:hypothetical protein C6382_07210 [Pseudomonas sp. BBP2017]